MAAGSQGIRAGRAFVELGVSDKLTRGLRAAQQRLQAFGTGLRAIGTRLAAIGGAAITGLTAAARAFAATGDVLDKMSRRTGISVEALSELGFAAEQSGTDLETLEAGVRRMQATVADATRGSRSAAETLAELGLSAADLQALAPEQQFTLLAERLSRIADPTLRAARALTIFGRSGTRLLPLLQDGARGLEAFREQARRLGLTVSTQTAKDAAALSDALHVLWRVLKQCVFIIGSALGGTLTDLADWVSRVVVRVTDWIKQNKELVAGILKVSAIVAGVGLSLITLGFIVSGLGVALGGLATLAPAIGSAFGLLAGAIAALAAPIGLAIAAVATLGAAILAHSDAGVKALTWLVDTFGWLKAGVLQVVDGIVDALVAGDMALAAKVLWLGLRVAWVHGTNALRELWETFQRHFINVLNDLVYGGLAVWVEFTAGTQSLWARMISGMQSAWSHFQRWHANQVEKYAGQLAKTWLRLRAIFDPSLDLDAALQSVSQQAAQRYGEIAQSGQRDLAEIEQRKQQELDRLAREREARLARIGAADAENERRRQAEQEQRMRAADDQLSQARAELEAALKQARDQRAAAEHAKPAPSRRVGGPVDDLEERIRGLGDQLARRIDVVGTFNPVALLGLGTGDAQERTARHTEQIAQHTKRLAEAARAGGVTFA